MNWKLLIKIFLVSLIGLVSFSCNNNLEELYLLSATDQAYPYGTPIDSDSDGKSDGVDVNGDGVIDMKFVAPSGPPATGIDINQDGKPDFYMYTDSSGKSNLNSKADGSGSNVVVVKINGQLIGYDTNADGVTDINVTGQSVTYYNIGGSANGLTSKLILSLTINSSSTSYLTLNSGNTSILFTEKAIDGSFYSVQIVSSSQSCSLSNNTGVVASTDVTGITLSCQPSYSVGGSTTGLTLGNTVILTLQANGVDVENITVQNAGTPINFPNFTFTTLLLKDVFYNVKITYTSQLCTIAANSGTIVSSNISTVAIDCPTTYLAGGGGNAGAAPFGALPDQVGVSLSVNGTQVETKNLTAGATWYTFNTGMLTGDFFNIQIISTTAASQHCTLSNNSGVIGAASVYNVDIQCPTLVPVSGTIFSSSSSILASLTVNGASTEYLSIAASGLGASAGFGPFITKLKSGDYYSVKVASSTQTCTVLNGSGTIAGTSSAPVPASVTNVEIYCGTYSYTLNSSTLTANFGTPIDGFTLGTPPAAPTATPDGIIDTINVNGNGTADFGAGDMVFIDNGDGTSIPIDINGNTGTIEFYLFINSAGTYQLTQNADGSGVQYNIIYTTSGTAQGYDNNGDTYEDITLAGATIPYYKVGGNVDTVTGGCPGWDGTVIVTYERLGTYTPVETQVITVANVCSATATSYGHSASANVSTTSFRQGDTYLINIVGIGGNYPANGIRCAFSAGTSTVLTSGGTMATADVTSAIIYCR